MLWSPQDSDRMRRTILGVTGEDVARCYQCGKCTASCPMASDEGFQPHKVMRALQLGDGHGAYQWAFKCVSCQTCTARCPQGIEVARVMDGVRQWGKASGFRPGPEDSFGTVFVAQVRDYGRIWEPALGLLFNLRAMKPPRDAGLAIRMLGKGKVAFLPERIKGRREVRRIFSSLQGGGSDDLWLLPRVFPSRILQRV